MALNSLMALLAQAPGVPAEPPPIGQQLLKTAPMMIAFGLMIYFLMIRPQSKKAKELAALMKSLRPGDKVLTSGGLLGVVLNVKEKSVSLRSGDSKLEVQKSAVAEIIERGAEATSS